MLDHQWVEVKQQQLKAAQQPAKHSKISSRWSLHCAKNVMANIYDTLGQSTVAQICRLHFSLLAPKKSWLKKPFVCQLPEDPLLSHWKKEKPNESRGGELR